MPLKNQTNVSMTNHALHHNPAIWGPDHDKFDPTRWLTDGYIKEKLNYLMPFGIGHRMCIGRNVAMINIVKTMVSLVRCYVFEPVDAGEVLEIETVGIIRVQDITSKYIDPRCGHAFSLTYVGLEASVSKSITSVITAVF
jgi:hypothetical protein